LRKAIATGLEGAGAEALVGSAEDATIREYSCTDIVPSAELETVELAPVRPPLVREDATAAALSLGTHQPRRRVGQWLLALRALYLGATAYRLVAGLTFLQHLAWFQAVLPTVFHMVLASFLLVLADYHLRSCPPAADA
jgi:hypothetical protein